MVSTRATTSSPASSGSSSATDCNMALILAKTESGQLEPCLAPTRKTITGPDGKRQEVTNGVRIHRMKK